MPNLTLQEQIDAIEIKFSMFTSEADVKQHQEKLNQEIEDLRGSLDDNSEDIKALIDNKILKINKTANGQIQLINMKEEMLRKLAEVRTELEELNRKVNAQLGHSVIRGPSNLPTDEEISGIFSRLDKLAVDSALYFAQLFVQDIQKNISESKSRLLDSASIYGYSPDSNKVPSSALPAAVTAVSPKPAAPQPSSPPLPSVTEPVIPVRESLDMSYDARVARIRQRAGESRPLQVNLILSQVNRLMTEHHHNVADKVNAILVALERCPTLDTAIENKDVKDALKIERHTFFNFTVLAKPNSYQRAFKDIREAEQQLASGYGMQ